MSATAAIDEPRFLRAFETELAATAERVPGRTVSTIFFGGGTPSLMQPADRAGDPRRHRQALEHRARRRGDAGGQSDQRRGHALSRLSRGRRQPRVARRAGARRCGAERARPLCTAAQEALDAVAVARSIFERYSFDLIYARPRQTLDAWGAELKRAIAASRRASLALSVDHRAGDAVLRPAQGRQVDRFPTTISAAISTISRRRSATRRDCRLTKFPTTHAPAPNAGTISFTGAVTTMPASAPARMAD